MWCGAKPHLTSTHVHGTDLNYKYFVQHLTNFSVYIYILFLSPGFQKSFPQSDTFTLCKHLTYFQQFLLKLWLKNQCDREEEKQNWADLPKVLL